MIDEQEQDEGHPVPGKSVRERTAYVHAIMPHV